MLPINLDRAWAVNAVHGMNLLRASKSFWVSKIFLLMRLVFEKLLRQEQWEAAKGSVNVVAQKAVRSDLATATKTMLNGIANAIQKFQLAEQWIK